MIPTRAAAAALLVCAHGWVHAAQWTSLAAGTGVPERLYANPTSTWVGIGVNPPTVPLHVVGRGLITNPAASTDALTVTQSQASGNILRLVQGSTTRLLVAQDGRMGIDHPNPQSRVHVSAGDYKLLRLTTTHSNMHVTVHGNPTGTDGQFVLASNGGKGGFVFGTGDPEAAGNGIGREIMSLQPAGTATFLHLKGGNGGGAGMRFYGGVAEQATIRTDLGSGDLVFEAGGVVGAGPQEKLRLKADGIIEVAGVRTKTWTVAPDYVFEKDYNLRTLDEVESFVKKNKHLPEVPSAKEFKQKGMDLAEMNFLLLKKVEELTLHAIRQEKEMRRQAEEIQSLKAPRR